MERITVPALMNLETPSGRAFQVNNVPTWIEPVTNDKYYAPEVVTRFAEIAAIVDTVVDPAIEGALFLNINWVQGQRESNP